MFKSISKKKIANIIEYEISSIQNDIDYHLPNDTTTIEELLDRQHLLRKIENILLS